MIGQIIASVFSASSTILDKFALSKYQTNVNHYIIVIFFFLWFFTGLTLPWISFINFQQAFSTVGIGYLILLVICAYIWNSIYYRSQQKESIQEFEVIVMTLPLFTSLLAALLFKDERNLHVFIATIVAGLALVLSHFRKDHLDFNKYSWQLIVAIIFMALESQIRKVLLDWYSPASLYFVRTGILTVLFVLVWQPKKIEFARPVWFHALLSGLTGAAMMILVFYGYKNLGIVLTTLILMLGPVLTYLFDFVFMKEKLKPKTIAAAVVILLSIVYAGLMS